jgi:DNA-binding NarL/FixJ family response regulator
MNLRILLVDDHEVVRLGLRALIEDEPGMDVVGEGLRLAKHLIPDVVVLDMRLPDGHGVNACRRLKGALPQTRIVVLTSYPDEEVILDAIACGADGYVLKQIGSGELLNALQRVGHGESLLDPAVTSRVFDKMREMRQEEWASAFSDLSGREKEILARVAEGKTNREIGDELGLSEMTARNHLSNILSKLGLTSRAQAAAYAARHRIEEYL